MHISSASPPPHAVVPDPTHAAVDSHSTPTTAPPAPPEQQRAERTDATGAQIKPGNASQKTSLSRSALHNLPNEILMTIAGHSSDRSLRALRRVSQHLHDIAQTKTSAPQNFIFANGAALQALGHSALAMHVLAERPAAVQNFVLANGAAL